MKDPFHHVPLPQKSMNVTVFLPLTLPKYHNFGCRPNISHFLNFQTLYKIARTEGIELAQPFNAVTTTWSQEDLNLALGKLELV